MGHRMELYVAPDKAQAIIDISKSFGIDARIVGYVEDSPTNKLTLQTEYGDFTY